MVLIQGPLMLKAMLSAHFARDNMIFAIKMFIASMLALYISLAMSLERPAWAMATVYIVANPLSGAVASKGIFRILGTVAGGAMAIAIVTTLVNSPELMSLAMACWVGFCLFVSLQDRTPRSYFFMLSGYTAAIIAFPVVDNPQQVFITAVARMEEIILGIVCVTLVSHLIFPRHIGPVLAGRIDGALATLSKAARDILAPHKGDISVVEDVKRLAASISELHGLAIHLNYEPSSLRGMTRPLQALQHQMVLLLPVLLEINDRINQLRSLELKAPQPLRELLDDILQWLESSHRRDLTRSAEFIRRISAVEQECVRETPWLTAMELSALTALRTFIERYAQCCQMWMDIRSGNIDMDRYPLGDSKGRFDLHRDRGAAMRSGVAALISVGLACAFWYVSAWNMGSTFAMMAAVGSSILASMDNPVPAMLSFVRYTVASLFFVFIYVCGVFPAIDGFPLLVLALAPVYLWFGSMLFNPANTLTALPILVNTAMLLNITNNETLDMAALANSAAAMVLGFLLPALVISFISAMTAEHSAWRLLRHSWRDLAEAARGEHLYSAEHFTRTMLDRIGLLSARLASAPRLTASAQTIWGESALGTRLTILQRLHPELPPMMQGQLQRLQGNIHDYYAAKGEGRKADPRLLDGSLAEHLVEQLLQLPATSSRRQAMLMLVGVKRCLALIQQAELNSQAAPTVV
ncbi:FUSC family protein [Pokkaliibacter plantistimulans]|uniref:FUSC family protein n=2 Tax=Pseudomonadota TaxID=1224 RepID=A0A2S5KRL8_9PROT|nr:FUSC family protein [Pokkaliibacter plantistimulans]